MFGIDDIAIAAMLSSAALSHYSQNRAAQKQQDAIRQAQARQTAARNAATDVAMRRVQEFDPDQRDKRQEDLSEQITGELQQQVAAPQITAQGVQVGSTIPDAAGGTDYLKAKARETAKSTDSLRALAALMGRTGSASELRRNEAIAMGDTAGEIGRIQSGASNIWSADQAGITAAGQPSIGAGLASAALGAFGTSRLMGGAKKANPFPEHGMPSGPNGGWV